jgi:hypothetical protein
MELAHFDEQNYQLELHAYRTTFPDFKYEPPSFVFVEIGTTSRVLEGSERYDKEQVELVNPSFTILNTRL